MEVQSLLCSLAEDKFVTCLLPIVLESPLLHGQTPIPLAPHESWHLGPVSFPLQRCREEDRAGTSVGRRLKLPRFGVGINCF